VRETVEFLSKEGVAGASEWGGWLAGGTWELHRHLYWAQPWAFWHMPGDVMADLGQSDLCFIKGDANYRRLLGDRSATRFRRSDTC
jgi:hypothetical protein